MIHYPIFPGPLNSWGNLLEDRCVITSLIASPTGRVVIGKCLRDWKKDLETSTQAMKVYWGLCTGSPGASSWKSFPTLLWTERELLMRGEGTETMWMPGVKDQKLTCMPKRACDYDYTMCFARTHHCCVISAPRNKTFISGVCLPTRCFQTIYLAYHPQEGAMWIHGYSGTKCYKWAVLVSTTEYSDPET